MNPTSKKLLSLFLIFSLVMLSGNLYAKKRRGAKLIITKKDGQQIKGELITVKPNSLLLLNTEGRDVSVGIADIKVIRVVKKSKARLGGGIGLLGGTLAGGIWGKGLESVGFSGGLLFGFFVFGIPSALIGAIIGSSIKEYKIIQIEGMTDSEIKEAMDKLSKKARIRDYK